MSAEFREWIMKIELDLNKDIDLNKIPDSLYSEMYWNDMSVNDAVIEIKNYMSIYL